MVGKNASISYSVFKEPLSIGKINYADHNNTNKEWCSIGCISNNNNIEYLISNISYNIDCSIRLTLDRE